MIRLQSERLLLRPFVADDFDALFALQSRADVARWLYWEPRDEEQVRAALAQRVEGTSLLHDGDSLNFAVVLKETSDVIGDGGLILRSAGTGRARSDSSSIPTGTGTATPRRRGDCC